MRADRTLRRCASTTLSAFLIVAVAAAPASALWSDDDERDDDSDGAGLAMVADIVIARPLGLVSMIAGAVIFTVALPIELMTGDVRTPAQKLIVEPARYTFQRPLGQI